MSSRALRAVPVLLLAVLCAVLEVFYLPLRAGAIPVPVSVLAAVAGNVAFTRLMYDVSGSVWLALLPGAGWLAVIGRAAIARPEGDLLITDGGASTSSSVVNLAFLLLGTLSLFFAVWTLNRPAPSPRSPDQPPDTAGRT